MAKWKAIVAEYQKPNWWRASWQLLNTIGTYVLVWYLLYLSLSISWWLTAPLAILAGGLLIRVFIIFHDCGHHSFFRSSWANDFWGFITGLLTFTPTTIGAGSTPSTTPPPAILIGVASATSGPSPSRNTSNPHAAVASPTSSRGIP
jgi:hypothetical protein